jgi:hypothetical protein
MVRQEEGKTHGYTWEFFNGCIKLEFVPKNFDYISRCKLCDLVNATNDNLHQYVKAYSELMLEIWHMYELNHVWHFVMGLSIWAKCKLKENWLASLSEAVMKVEGFLDVGWGEKSGFKKENKFPHKKARHEGEWSRRQDPQKGKNPNTFKARVSNSKENSSRKGFLSKGVNPRGMLMGSPKGRVSITTKWGIIPKIAPNPN